MVVAPPMLIVTGRLGEIDAPRQLVSMIAAASRPQARHTARVLRAGRGLRRGEV